MRSSSKRAWTICVAALLLLIGTWIRLWDLDAGGLWYDEYLTSIRVSGSLNDLVTAVAPQANQTLFYYLILSLFPTHHDLLLRYPSVLMGMLGIALTIGLTRRLYSAPRLALWAGALIAFNPYHIWLSRNARVYPLAVVMSLLVSYFFLRLLAGPTTRRVWVAFAVSSIVAYQTHYFLLMLPVVQFVMLALYLRNDRGWFWRWVAVQAVAGSLMLMWMAYQTRQPVLALEINWIPHPRLVDVPLTLWNLSIGYPLNVPWYGAAGFVLVAGLLMWGSVSAVRNHRSAPQHVYWFLLLWLPLALVFLLSVTLKPAYVDRYFAALIPALVMLLVIGLYRLPRQIGRIAFAVLIAVMGANIVREFVRGDHVRADWEAVAHLIDQSRQPDEGILIPAFSDLVKYYSAAPAELESARMALDDNSSGLLVDLTGASTLREASAVWVVVRVSIEDIHRVGRLPEIDPLAQPDDLLSQWLALHRDQITDRWHFNGVQVFYVEFDNPLRVGTETESPAGN